MKLSKALKRAAKIWLYICAAAFFVLIIEGLYFFWVIHGARVVTKADAVVVFAGDSGRIEAGCGLAGDGYAPYLIISAAGQKRLDGYRAHYKLPSSVAFIKEENARTTFENAYFVGKIIRDRHFKSIILVTSWYHLPRAFFLLKAVLRGRDVEVQLFCPKTDRAQFWGLHGERKLLRDEMIALWASLSEYAYCGITGGVPTENPKGMRLIRRLKKLFSI